MQKKLLYLSFFFSLLSLTLSCQTEDYDFTRDAGSIEILEDGRLRVPFQLHIPEREVVETKATTDDERRIKTVDVCVFDANGVVLEKVKGEIDPDNRRVFANVLPRNHVCKIQVYANIPSEARVKFNAAATETEIAALTMSKLIFGKDSIEKNGLPLVSALDIYTVLNSTTLKDKVATLKFAYARIDIENKTNGFTPASCTGLNFRENCYLIERTPLTSLAGGYESVATNQFRGIYLFESSGSMPTDLLIKGTNAGFGEGYYKIRISNGDKNAVSDIRRSVRYVVHLTSVKGPGYATEKEAIDNEPANIEYDIIVEDGLFKDVIISNGSYYLGVSNSEYIIFANQADGVIATTFSHNAPVEIVTTRSIQVEGEGFTLSPNQEGLTLDETNKSARIDSRMTKVSVKLDILSTAVQTGTLTIRIGDLLKTITIKKRDLIADEGRTIQLSELDVLSIVTMKSLSPRITVNPDKSLEVGKTIIPGFRIYSYAEAFTTGHQGTIRIAVK